MRSGVAAAARSLAVELAPDVLVNVIVTGQFDTRRSSASRPPEPSPRGGRRPTYVPNAWPRSPSGGSAPPPSSSTS